MKAVSGVYQISNKLTGEKYIGSSVNIRKRANRHKSDLTRGAHSNILLQRAWDFYGANHFEFCILLICDRDNTLLYEQVFLDIMSPEYNIATDAKSSSYGVKRTDEEKEHLSKINTGKKLSEEHKKKNRLG